MNDIVYKYPNYNLVLSKIKLVKNIVQNSENPIKIFIITMNGVFYVIKIKDEKYVKWNKNKIHNDRNFIKNYKYIIENIDKSLLIYFYKIINVIYKNNKFYHIMEKYDYDLDYFFFDKIHSVNILKNLLVKIQLILFYLNNKLHIYHNDIIHGSMFNIRNIMYNKRKNH